MVVEVVRMRVDAYDFNVGVLVVMGCVVMVVIISHF